MDPPIVSSAARSGKGETLIEEPTRAEQTLARRVAESRATVPDLELRAAVDMSSWAALRREQKAAVSISALLAKACALSLRDVPRANGSYRDGRFELHSRVNVGIAVRTEEGRVIATLFDADMKSPAELHDELTALARRARTGELTPPELSGATFTLSNIGALGVTSSTIVITTPQAAAVAAGEIREVPVVRNGEVVPGLTMLLTLVCDHRILYGVRAATFLTRIKARLEQPASLWATDPKRL